MLDTSKKLHPATEDVLRFFDFGHLPDGPLKETSRKFYGLAYELAYDSNTDGPQLTLALQDLLRAKDAAVRSTIPKRY